MRILKKSHLLLILSLVILFTGCIKKLDTDGLTLKIDESELNSASKDFPIEKSFLIAKVVLDKPNIYIKKNTNKIEASLDLSLSAIFIPKTKGTLTISGNPYFNKKDSSIYLKDVSIENLNFENSKMSRNFSISVLSSMEPIVDELFKKFPVYKIDKNSFKGSFVKDMKIENSEILVTFGL